MEPHFRYKSANSKACEPNYSENTSEFCIGTNKNLASQSNNKSKPKFNYKISESFNSPVDQFLNALSQWVKLVNRITQLHHGCRVRKTL